MTVVTVDSLDGYLHAQMLTAPGRDAIVADEPSADEGDDIGPTPYDLLLWALGACTSMTLQMYARRRAYPLEGVSIDLEHERIHADDCAECGNEREGRIDVIRRRITLRGPLTDEQRDDLLRIASRCPVYKTIANVPEVIDTLGVAP